jgi:RNA ligase (TIGR02306 family)
MRQLASIQQITSLSPIPGEQSIKAGKVKRFLMRYSWFRRVIVKPARLPFPNFIKQTDETRIQNMPNICTDLAGVPLQITEKIDGQSATYFVIKSNKKSWQFWKEKYIFGVCSRRFWLVKEDFTTSWWKIARMLRIKEYLIEYCEKYNTEIVVQGEIIGTGIQGNKYGITGYDFRVFNIVDLHSGAADNKQQHEICRELHLKCVPSLPSIILPKTISEAIDISKGKSKMADIPRAGIVCRDYANGRSFKIINPVFLLTYDL